VCEHRPVPSFYLVESSYFTVSHGVRESQGMLGDTKAAERIYLHVLPLTGAEVKSLRPRPDEHGNLDHTRFALRGRDDWWIAVEGEASWPKLFRPRMTSRFKETDMGPVAAPLTDAELDLLRSAGLQGI
jgi:hypothetical protein